MAPKYNTPNKYPLHTCGFLVYIEVTPPPPLSFKWVWRVEKKILEAMGNLNTLTLLNLSECEGMKDILGALDNLISLIPLNSSGCKELREIQKELGNLTSLTTLDLGGCKCLKGILDAWYIYRAQHMKPHTQHFKNLLSQNFQHPNNWLN